MRRAAASRRRTYPGVIDRCAQLLHNRFELGGITAMTEQTPRRTTIAYGTHKHTHAGKRRTHGICMSATEEAFTAHGLARDGASCFAVRSARRIRRRCRCGAYIVPFPLTSNRRNADWSSICCACVNIPTMSAGVPFVTPDPLAPEVGIICVELVPLPKHAERRPIASALCRHKLPRRATGQRWRSPCSVQWSRHREKNCFSALLTLEYLPYKLDKRCRGAVSIILPRPCDWKAVAVHTHLARWPALLLCVLLVVSHPLSRTLEAPWRRPTTLDRTI